MRISLNVKTLQSRGIIVEGVSINGQTDNTVRTVDIDITPPTQRIDPPLFNEVAVQTLREEYGDESELILDHALDKINHNLVLSQLMK